MHIETKTVTDVIPYDYNGADFAVKQPTKPQTKEKPLIIGAGGENVLLLKPTKEHVIVPLTRLSYTAKVRDDTALLKQYQELGFWIAERVAVLEDTALRENKDFEGIITVWMHKVEWNRSTLSLTAYVGLSCI